MRLLRVLAFLAVFAGISALAAWPDIVLLGATVGAAAVAGILAWLGPHWRRIWEARVPVIVGLVGTIALAVPPQTRDLLVGTDTILKVPVFFVALFLSGVSAWFWTRWVINLARVRRTWKGAPRGATETALPRVMAVLPPIAVLGTVLARTEAFGTGRLVLLLAGTVAVAVALVGLAWNRRGVRSPWLRMLFVHDEEIDAPPHHPPWRDPAPVHGQGDAPARPSLREQVERAFPFHPRFVWESWRSWPPWSGARSSSRGPRSPPSRRSAPRPSPSSGWRG
ncbi:hypothetical protein ACE7GA_09360 [Roseomonas sp. CCTCC AB2023176]|uniref:hypothetical protein n=1 Tax=Roseomonas sp. CCTCC AB2023176 TaxID=3342640 RepID=UPI0035DB7B8F